MTIASTASSEFTVAQIIRRAMRRAMLLEVEQEPSEKELGDARMELQLVMYGLAARGLHARLIRLVEVTVEANVAAYALPAGYTDAVFTAAFAEEGETSTTTTLVPVTTEDWQNIAARDVGASPPTQYWVDKSQHPAVVHLWPTPDGAGTIVFQGMRSLADIGSASDTIDLQPYWLPCVVLKLAAALAQNAGLDKAALLEQQAEKCFEYAWNESQSTVSSGFVIDYGARSR